MKRRRMLAVLPLLAAVPCTAQEVIWDYGPQTGPAGGCWANVAENQNFAELVVLDQSAGVTGYQLFTCIDGIEGLTFEIKFLADDGGTPGADIARFEVVPTGHALEGGQQRYDFEFDPVPLDAGSYWIGLAGIGFEAGQTSINPGPGNSQMAQFNGQTFVIFTPVGDQMFRLLADDREDCYADCDEDGALTFFDFLCFTNEFNAGNGYADCDQDQSLTFFDFLCFTNAFNQAC